MSSTAACPTSDLPPRSRHVPENVLRALGHVNEKTNIYTSRRRRVRAARPNRPGWGYCVKRAIRSRFDRFRDDYSRVLPKIRWFGEFLPSSRWTLPVVSEARDHRVLFQTTPLRKCFVSSIIACLVQRVSLVLQRDQTDSLGSTVLRKFPIHVHQTCMSVHMYLVLAVLVHVGGCHVRFFVAAVHAVLVCRNLDIHICVEAVVLLLLCPVLDIPAVLPRRLICCVSVQTSKVLVYIPL
jgi:hypothetical protein